MKLPSNKTKIICTIGPTSRSREVIKDLIINGMNIARLNFSHGNNKEHREDIQNIKNISKSLNKPVSILIDLPGSKLRIGQLGNEPIYLNEGKEIILSTNNKILGNEKIIPVDYKELPKSVKKGSKIFLNDGFIELKVKKIINDDVFCKVISSGMLLSYKGMNLPKAKIFKEPFTKKDYKSIDFGLENGINIFGASFIQSKNDILTLKNYAKKKGKEIFIVAKIERYNAVKNFDEILNVSDAIMIARGDLGIELPIQDVPTIQKKLIKKANIASVPVIVATQMLNSMTTHTQPTRAEVTDVANAILDGTDSIMLSEETAIGDHPVKVVKMMNKIAINTEQKKNGYSPGAYVKEKLTTKENKNQLTTADLISLNVIDTSKILKTKYILVTTSTGSTARRISRFKPNCWILSFSRNKKTYEFLQLSYGTYPFHMQNKDKSWHDLIIKFIKKSKLVKKDDRLILTQRRFGEEKGGTDSLGIIKI